jgi:geranylgeranyl diphosphate synthase type II
MTADDGSAACRYEVEIAGARASIEQRLDALTPGELAPQRLAEAMRYSLLAPAKRVRAILAVLCARHCGGAVADALPAACALEMVHAASLILDDLPAMDDALMRRGQPACHRQHGEATATLAAIALMNRAFGVVAGSGASAAQRIAVVGILARSIGTDGLTGGQEGDLHGSGLSGLAGIAWTHARKTGALFAAAAEIGAVVAGAEQYRAAMSDFGMRLGIAFQAYDDLLDAKAAPAAIGKDIKRDVGKATLVSLVDYDDALLRAGAQMAAAFACCPQLQLGDSPLHAYLAGLEAQLRAPLGLVS